MSSLAYIIVQDCRRGGFELLDPYGRYLGCALTLDHARRFGEDVEASVVFQLGNPSRVKSMGARSWLGRFRTRLAPSV